MRRSQTRQICLVGCTKARYAIVPCNGLSRKSKHTPSLKSIGIGVLIMEAAQLSEQADSIPEGADALALGIEPDKLIICLRNC